ncbi:hypothetical protein niasHT_024517 [Heterodera trifolii]|uniref:Transthyretin-like family protein n=1 Tax=Heterodera trifolii TaxID=157864 RepID=A0ABD2K785_9BILA
MPTKQMLLCSILLTIHFASQFNVFGLENSARSVAVRGSMFCNGNPSEGLTVRLYDRESLEHDDMMTEGTTDQSGNFELIGHEEEAEAMAEMDPRLIIFHECNVPCIVQMIIKVPSTFVSLDPIPHKTFDIGTIHLDKKLDRNFKCAQLA